MASSISFRSSSEMRGCTAGDSKIIKNHKIDQINPMPPIYFMMKHSIDDQLIGSQYILQNK